MVIEIHNNPTQNPIPTDCTAPFSSLSLSSAARDGHALHHHPLLASRPPHYQPIRVETLPNPRRLPTLRRHHRRHLPHPHTLSLHNFSLLPAIPSAALRLITAVHNLTLCLLSLLMAVGCAISAAHQTPPHHRIWPICFPAGQTPPRGPTFFWAHVFYFSKILEFVDTLLILLSGSRSRRLSFLHVYHHAVVVVMCYVWLAASQSLFPVALVTNATVHVVMYGYYLVAALGIRPWWKRLVTDFQIFQFVFSFLISGWMMYHHFSGSGCEGMWGWCFNAVFNGSLLALFVNFHLNNYAKKKRLDLDKDKITS